MLRGYIWLIRSFLINRPIKVVLNKHLSSSFHINEGVPQRSIVGPKLILIFINDLSDVTSFKLGIYTAYTTIYSCLSIKFDRSNKVKLTAAPEKHLQSEVWFLG